MTTYNAKLHMKPTTNFVVTNTPALISPAGFSPSEHVFERTEIAIQFKNYPKASALPAYEGNLYLHDLKTLIKG